MFTQNEPLVSTANISQFQNITNDAEEKDPYDSYGAMLFIIAVIVVYGIAVIGMLGFYSGRGEQMEDFDKQANTWLKEYEVRQRQLEIKSRKSVFSKRLSELREDLSEEHGPRLHSHVANYLIASIGMKSRDRPSERTKEKANNMKAQTAYYNRTQKGNSSVSNVNEDISSKNASKLQCMLRISENCDSKSFLQSKQDGAHLATRLEGTLQLLSCPAHVHSSQGLSENSAKSAFSLSEGSTTEIPQKTRLISDSSMKQLNAAPRLPNCQRQNYMSNDEELCELLSGECVEYESVV